MWPRIACRHVAYTTLYLANRLRMPVTSTITHPPPTCVLWAQVCPLNSFVVTQCIILCNWTGYCRRIYTHMSPMCTWRWESSVTVIIFLKEIIQRRFWKVHSDLPNMPPGWHKCGACSHNMVPNLNKKCARARILRERFHDWNAHWATVNEATLPEMIFRRMMI